MTEQLLLTRQEAARKLGMSLNSFKRYVQPHLPCVYVGQLRQYRPVDLQKWIDDNTSPPGRQAA